MAPPPTDEPLFNLTYVESETFGMIPVTACLLNGTGTLVPVVGGALPNASSSQPDILPDAIPRPPKDGDTSFGVSQADWDIAWINGCAATAGMNAVIQAVPISSCEVTDADLQVNDGQTTVAGLNVDVVAGYRYVLDYWLVLGFADISLDVVTIYNNDLATVAAESVASYQEEINGNYESAVLWGQGPDFPLSPSWAGLNNQLLRIRRSVVCTATGTLSVEVGVVGGTVADFVILRRGSSVTVTRTLI